MPETPNYDAFDAYFEQFDEESTDVFPGISQSLIRQYGEILAIHKGKSDENVLLVTTIHGNKDGLNHIIAHDPALFETFLRYQLHSTNCLIAVRQASAVQSIRFILEGFREQYFHDYKAHPIETREAFMVMENMRRKIMQIGKPAIDEIVEQGPKDMELLLNGGSSWSFFHANRYLSGDEDILAPAGGERDAEIKPRQKMYEEQRVLALRPMEPDDRECRALIERWKEYFDVDNKKRHAYIAKQTQSASLNVISLGNAHFKNSTGASEKSSVYIEDEFSENTYCVVRPYGQRELEQAIDRKIGQTFYPHAATPQILRIFLRQLKWHLRSQEGIQ